MKNIDRISEAYYGQLGENLMNASRDRLNWICSQAKGENILDVGCSQGIVPIFLAREGKYVKGIDICKESIEYAKEELAKEDENTKVCAKFIYADFISYTTENTANYDCIIMSELLEHITDTERFVKRAYDRLEVSGVLVVTVPFGINDYHDHKRTYYTTELYYTMNKYFAVQDIVFFGDWIGMIGIKDSSAKSIPIDEELFIRTEKAVHLQERKLRNHIIELNNVVKNEKKSVGQWKEKAEENIKKLNEALKAYNDLKNNNEKMIEQNKLYKLNNEKSLEDIKRSQKDYKELSNSKLGRIQIRIWKKKAKKRNKKLISAPKKEAKESLHHDDMEINVLTPISNLRIATIMDEFSSISFGLTCKTFPITISDFREELIEAEPHFLLVESAWNGSNGNWGQKIGKYTGNDWKELRAVIKFCRDKGIPTVFWNKEDPVHFEKFIDAAKLFDRVYTTDINMIEKYQKYLGHKNVGALMFAAQPKTHNPIFEEERKAGSFFAGSYYANRHEKRREDMDSLFDAAACYQFAIYDRNEGTSNADFMYPERFRPFIKGKLDYSEINKAYKGYQVAINVNSVVDSETMFSRRVFECLACGTPVVSTPSVGISKKFFGIVPTAKNKDEYKETLGKIIENGECWGRLSHLGVREVMQKHTYAHRVKQICNDLDIEIEIGDKPLVTVIATASNREELFSALNVFRKQTYVNKKLWLIVSRFDGWINAVNMLQSEEVLVFFAEHIDNVIMENENENWIAYIEPANMWYGINYILDLVIAQQYSNADVIVKSDATKDFKNELSFIFQNVNPYMSLIRESAFNTYTLQELREILLKEYEPQEINKVFCADRYNFSHKNKNCVNNKLEDV